MGGSFGTTALLPLCKHSTSESDSKSKPGVCVPADLTGTYGKGSTHEDTGDTHWLSPIPSTAPPDHSAEPNPIYGVETLTLWGWSLCILNAPHAAGDHGMSEMQSPVQPQGPSSPPRMEEVTQPCCSLLPHSPALLFLPPPTKG